MKDIVSLEQAEEIIKKDKELREWVRNELIYPGGEAEIDHIIKGLTSMLAEIFDIYDAGHFIKAVLRNDFVDAVCRADNTNLKYIKVYALFVYNYIGMSALREYYRRIGLK